jgi:hypothetical protein
MRSDAQHSVTVAHPYQVEHRIARIRTVQSIGTQPFAGQRTKGPPQLMTGCAAVVTHHEARYVHRLEVSQSKACETLEIGVVPSRVRSAN